MVFVTLDVNLFFNNLIIVELFFHLVHHHDQYICFDNIFPCFKIITERVLLYCIVILKYDFACRSPFH